MKNILLIIFLFTITETIAQNYNVVNMARPAFYKFNVYPPYQFETHTLKFDSVFVNGTDTDYFSYPVMYHGNDLFINCMHLNDTSWAGLKVTAQINGDVIFRNKNNESIVLKSQASLNDSWHLYDAVNGNYFLATVTNIVQQNFIGVVDSVKQISIQYKNPSNQNLPHPLNGNSISLSQNNGLVKFINAYWFPNDSITCELVGIENPDYGIANLTADEIFDFAPGDTFQYYTEEHPSIPYHNYKHDEKIILSKWFSPGNDTVNYSIQHTALYKFNSYMNYSSYFNVDTIIQSYALNFEEFNNYPYQAFYDFQFPNSIGWPVIIDNDTNYYHRIKKKTNPYHYIGWGDCILNNISTCLWIDNYYATGLGLVKLYDNNGFSGSCRDMNLVFYSKNNASETWGNRVDFQVLLAANEFRKQQISVFPNPFTDVLTISNIENLTSESCVTVFNALGQKMLMKKFNQSESIQLNTTEFPKGFYVLHIQTEESSVSFRLLK